ncbi:DEAD/DEAH box helicase [Streptomyces cinnabarinus]|uniref:RNA helicase n=1 Tax=Streptomyces cinnabarinus TaxID=67287 RepID=A0ABY7KKN4_9ACTN|nr:DEAD/DEAH box helicase [Streptomyces cinnabarinus]WAZ23967.1 DEAD/DEAH box helicase [Streptomyces cinnabarinus]
MAADVPRHGPSQTPALASHRAHRRGSTLTTTFRELGILPETAEALEAVGIVNPFPIQEMTLPVALSGTDVIGQAKTGTGKTLGFGLPLLERVTVPADVEAGRAKPEDLTDAPQALVVVPTRELCTQVTNDLLTAGKVRNVRVLAIYGGRAYEPQVEALKKGVDVIVGTPGRLLDLAGQKKLDLKHIKALVLDEADEMLDLGFLPDVEKIINMLPARRQTMLFSATMPGAVIGLARRYMSQPTHIRATAPDDEGVTVANISQHVYRAHNMDKPEMVARILQADGRGLAMVFCRTKRTAADLADQLKQRGFASGAVHGDLGQGAREQALRAFRNGKVDVLVCTDVAARGIDVEGVTHVINYQSPEEEKTYLHRIGRTGRAGASGTAITLVDWDDIPRWQLINKALELNFNDPVETYSTSPHLFEELSIPAGTKGVLPRSERTRAGLDAEELEDLGETGGRGARGRGGRGEGRDESRSADRERSARTPRRRRRTRGGAVLDPNAAPAGTDATEATPSAPSAEESATRTPRRRRRTRGGAAPEAVQTASTATESAEAALDTAEGTTAMAEGTVATAEAGTEAADKPRRRRTRKSAEPTVTSAEETVVAEPAPVVESQESVTAESEPAATKPRRRTRKAAEPVAEAVLDTAEATEAKPRRTRKATTEAAAEVAVDTAEAVEAKPKTRRTRKTAEAAPEPETVTETKPRRTRKVTAEVAVDTAEAVEAKPKTRRTRKTAEVAPEPETAAETKPRRTRKAVEPADIPAQAAEEPAAPRRRTRKAAEVAVDTAEAVEAKPKTRRTRKTAEAAPEPETVTETKPRRTRKAAEAAVDTAEAKPTTRRTRKTAVAAEPAEIPAQAADEPTAPRRRTRKATTAAVETAEVPEAKPRTRRTRKATVAAEPTES